MQFYFDLIKNMEIFVCVKSKFYRKRVELDSANLHVSKYTSSCKARKNRSLLRRTRVSVPMVIEFYIVGDGTYIV